MMRRHMKKDRLVRIASISLAVLLMASMFGVFAGRTGPTMLACAPAAQTPAAAAAAPIATINQYCVGWHSDRAKTGGVSFEGLKPENIGERAEVFEKAVRKLRGRVMPPPGAKQPEAKEIDALVGWLETSLDRAA